MPDAATTTLAYACPVCGEHVTERFYGPCEACRGALRATAAGEARTVEEQAYEPKVNVTPNAVAFRDD
ncbi:MAG: hypothetical protein ACRDZN_16085 [Acidimicrobiales bacterium]